MHVFNRIHNLLLPYTPLAATQCQNSETATAFKGNYTKLISAGVEKMVQFAAHRTHVEVGGARAKWT